MERERAFMSDEVFDVILHRYIIPYKEMNRFCTPTFIAHKDGEPLLNKKLPSVLRKLADVLPDMNIDIYSHGLMLTKWRERGQDFFEFLATLPNHCRYLMSYHPKNHDESINDYNATFRYMKEVLQNPPRNVEFIMVAHKAQGAPPTDEWLELWKPERERGVLTVHANASINPWAGRIDDPNVSHFNGCPYGDFGHWFFGVTGNIIACCIDLEEEIIFGNVLHDEPSAMVTKLDAFYADQRAKKVDHAVCHNCHGLPPAPGDLQSLTLRT